MKDLLYFDWNIVVVLLNFFVIMCILKKFLYKPVKKMLAERETEVTQTYAQAEQAKAEAMGMKKDYEVKLNDAKQTAGEIIADATKKAQSRGDELVAAASAKSDDMIKKAEVQIAQDKKRAINEIKNDIADIAINAATKVVSKQLDVNDHKQLIDDFIENAGDVKWQD